jgi:schlafen family protein
MNDDIISRLRDCEDGFTERKTEGAANPSELRKTLVAFANSVPEGKTSILFLGVSDDGTPMGVNNPDSLQKTIRKVAEKDCYPPVNYQTIVFQADGKTLLAIEVKASNERPHFSGPAFIRRGSESVAASKPIYDELIATRNTKAGKILCIKNDVITFQSYELGKWGNKRPVSTMECRIEKCDAHVVDLYDIASCRHFSIPVEELTINFDQKKRRWMLKAPSE